MQLYRICLIEDDCLTRDALSLYIGKSRSCRVLWSGSLARIQSAGLRHIDLVVVGQSAATSPIELIEQVHSVMPNKKIVFFVTHPDADAVARLVALPYVVGILSKGEISRGIAEALVKACEGHQIFSRRCAEYVLSLDGMSGLKRPLIIDDPSDVDEETEVGRAIYLFAILGLSKEEISLEMSVPVSTVSSRIRAAYQNLDVSNRREAFDALLRSALSNQVSYSRP